jgi:hypothetical protein
MMHQSKLVTASLIALAAGSSTASPASKAQAVINASKMATGGAAWDKLQAADEVGTRGDGTQPYRTWLNFLAYGMRNESHRGDAVMTQGFNGSSVWRRGPDGKVAMMSDGKARVEAILTAYISNNGYYFPRRFPATFRYVRRADESGRASDVIEITPSKSRPFEIWFDQNNRQVWRIIDRGNGPPITVEASDYRSTGGVLVPYMLTVTGPDGTIIDRATVKSVTFGPVDTSLFDPAKP